MEFGIQTMYRHKARESFVRWDCSQKVARANLRKAAPVPGPYRVGDGVSYCREPRKGETGLQWSVGSRIVGFEYAKGQDENVTATNAWVVCDGFPVCVATHKLRPCTSADL